MKAKNFSVNHYRWEKNGYQPKVDYTLSVENCGFHMHIVVHESNPKREKTEHFQHVHEDSCVEWFANFMPDQGNQYFNFEVNANGCMNVSFGTGRHDRVRLSEKDVESLNIYTIIGKFTWEVEYTVPFTLIKKYYPAYERKDGKNIKANFYKCGDKTEYPHYGMWSKVEVKNPDFHRPEYFGEIELV